MIFFPMSLSMTSNNRRNSLCDILVKRCPKDVFLFFIRQKIYDIKYFALIYPILSLQIEDFINETSITPMSSIPVQFLIYVTPVPVCSQSPVIIFLISCAEITVGTLTNFNISVLNLCNPAVVNIADVIATDNSIGIQMGNLTSSPLNASISYKSLTWTPQISQIGSQQLCMIAYTK